MHSTDSRWYQKNGIFTLTVLISMHFEQGQARLALYGLKTYGDFELFLSFVCDIAMISRRNETAMDRMG